MLHKVIVSGLASWSGNYQRLIENCKKVVKIYIRKRVNQVLTAIQPKATTRNAVRARLCSEGLKVGEDFIFTNKSY